MKENQKPYTLITGANGYIAQHLISKFKQIKRNTVLIDHVPLERKSDAPFYLGEFDSKDILSEIFNKFKIDDVIHLAALKSVPDSFLYPKEYFYTNAIKTLNLYEQVNKKSKKFIFASSAAVYGGTNEEIYSESSKCVPLSPYGRSKLFAERLLKDNQISNNPIVILRFFNIAGLYVTNLKPSGVFNILCDCALQRKAFHVNKSNGNTSLEVIRDYVDIDDIVQAIILACDFDTKQNYNIFNVASGGGISLLTLIEDIEMVSGLHISIRQSENSIHELNRVVGDMNKIMNVLDWHPNHTLLSTIERTLMSMKK
jgi:UDP-glucose 4-epimerase